MPQALEPHPRDVSGDFAMSQTSQRHCTTSSLHVTCWFLHLWSFWLIISNRWNAAQSVLTICLMHVYAL